MTEPKIYIYDPTKTPQSQLFSLVFTAVGGGAVKAGTTSAPLEVAIWNNPYTTTAINEPTTSAGGALIAWGYSGDNVSAATNVDVTVVQVDSSSTGGSDVVTGEWVAITFITASQTGTGDDQLNGGKYKNIGLDSTNSTVAATIGTINANSDFIVQFTFTPATNASAGPKNWYTRVSYSFT